MKISFSVKKFSTVLIIVVIALNAIGFIGRLVEYRLGIKETTEFVRLFHVAEEGNITSWYSSLSLLFCAILLAFIANVKKSAKDVYGKHWGILSLIFVFLSLDEAATIHEISILPLRKLLNLTGVLHYSWVIVAIPLLLFFLFYFSRFLISLPKDTRNLFVFAGIVFVGGALGLEMVSGYLLSSEMERRLVFNSLSITLEELAENVGIVIYIYALLFYIKTHLEAKEIVLDIR